MSLKDLFKEDDNLRSFEPITKADIDADLESYDYLKAVQERSRRFLPLEKFAKPETFAKFGSAEKYYEDSIRRIYNTYPYDGSLKEKIQWELSSSVIDIFLLENGYPRTTGYATFSSASFAATVLVNGYGAVPTASYEFISLQGGPHKGTGKSLYYDQWQDTTTYRKDANILDRSQNRENNLKIDGIDGNTVEFWLKKEAFLVLGDPDYTSEKEVIIDVFVSGTTQVDQEYGRLRVELTGTADVGATPWLVTFSSGTLNAMMQQPIGRNITTASVADGQWHHYAFIFQNNADNPGNAVQCDLFIDGAHNSRAVGTGEVFYVSGALEATVGALGSADPPETGVTALNGALKGYAKLSGSLDEVRYWKTARTSKKIQQYWFDQVGGGTNSDLANTHLGVYYKFNEGITTNVAIDANVLDYSGRISNGTWTGYNPLFSRSTGSAMIESSASAIEFRDPIIYPSHLDVVSFLNTQKGIGKDYDTTNVNSLVSYMPTWMLEINETAEADANKNVLMNLLQILSSYFDNASLLIDKIPSLSEPKYYTSGTFPPPFNKRLLESRGFVAPDIFMDLSLLEQFAQRDNTLLFQESVEHVKRTIYQNIYNNLIYLYKSKGTEKSFRNLIRCFGIDDEVLKFNIYTKNNTFKIQDNTKYVTKTKQYANFNEVENGDATVYQHTASDDTNATSFLTMGPGLVGGDVPTFSSGTAFTLAADVILPNHVTIAEYATVKENYDGKVQNHYPLIVSSSLFGLHDVTSVENVGTWINPDWANFQVYAVKENNDKFSTTAKFVLSSVPSAPAGPIETILPIESPFFEDIYDDQKWTLAVSVFPEKQGVNQVGGTSGSDMGVPTSPDQSDYIIRFYGCNHISDIKYQSFEVSATIPQQAGDWGGAFFWHWPNKRIFAGAHRTDFNGSLREFSDAKISAVKAWYANIPTSSIDQHNKKAGNYGAAAPTKNAFLYEEAYNSVNIPEIGTLALHWDFTTVSSSDASGQFFVEDVTSGSNTDNRYGDFSTGVSRRHPGRGDFFQASSTDAVQNIARATLKQQVPEVLIDSNLTKILTQDDEFFNRAARPITYYFSIEKNLFQSISEEMLDMFASIKYLNNLIGEPVNLYRSEYKELGKLRELFFEKVGNDYDFDKYVEYYKYIDYAIGQYIEKLIPASMSTFRKGITTTVENFALDRNKYANKFPIIKDKMPPILQAQALGINELLYDWEFGHAPSSSAGFGTPESVACLWWKERAERTGSLSIVSSDNAVNIDKQTMLDSIVNETNASAPTVSQTSSAGTSMYSGSTYVTRRLAKPYRLTSDQSPYYHGGSNFYQNKKYDIVNAMGGLNLFPNNMLEISNVEAFEECTDGLDLGKKRKYKYEAAIVNLAGAGEQNYFRAKGDLFAPFSLYSASIAGGYHDEIAAQFMVGADITNFHDDTYGPAYEVPMQGPFTEKYVGGYQYRHIDLNYSGTDHPLDTAVTRPEGRLVELSSGEIEILGQWLSTDRDPPAWSLREPLAKRPVNIANILQTTGSSPTKIGNYEHDYDIVQTSGRTINNLFFVESEGIEVIPQTSLVIFSPGATPPGAPLVDYTLPDRSISGSNKFVFVNRFSAPGGPEVSSLGFMDVEAAEFSVYNALPFRNLTVRLPLQELLTDHCKQFGYFSDAQNSASYVLAGVAYPGTSGSVNTGSYYATAGYTDATASFHKVNRNTRLQPFIANTGSFFNTLCASLVKATPDYIANLGTAATDGLTICTYSMWVNPIGTLSPTLDMAMNLGGAQRTIDIRGNTPATRFVRFGADFSTTDGVWDTDEGSIIVGEWHNVVVVYDGSLTTNVPVIYINGAPMNVTTFTEPQGTLVISYTAPYTILGIDASIGALFAFDGFIDEVSLWNKALTAGEVQEIFNSTDDYCYGGPSNLFQHSAVASLINWWRMGDEPGDALPAGPIIDLIGGINLTTIGGAPTLSADVLSAYCYAIKTKPAYDNAYIQHQIPQTDVQYAWIKASLIEGYTGSALYGFEEPNYSLASMASTDLTFCSASDVGSNLFRDGGFVEYGRMLGAQYGNPVCTVVSHPETFLPTDFVGLNSNIVEPISSSTNILGYPSLVASFHPGCMAEVNYVNTTFCDAEGANGNTNSPMGLASVLSALIGHRQGPYGWPTWKQIRGGIHPIARYQRNHNIIQYIDFVQTWTVQPFQGVSMLMPGGTAKTIISTTEPPLSSKYKPLTFVMPSHSPAKFEESFATVAYGNALVKFTDHRTEFVPSPLVGSTALDLDAKLNTVATNTYSNFGAMRTLLAKSNYAANPDDFIKVSYSETIYPKGQYTYLSGSRKRTSFTNTFWRTHRFDRTIRDLPNSLSDSLGGGVVLIPTASMWKLDGHLNFTDNADFWTSGSTNFRADGAGELQNNYCLWRNSLEPGHVSWVTNPVDPGAFVYNAEGCQLTPLPRAASEYARRIPYVDINEDNGPQARSGSYRPNYTAGGGLGECNAIPILGKPAYLAEYSFPDFEGFTGGSTEYFVYDTIINGDTKWTAAEESPLNYQPFYDSYDDYIEDLFRASKDATIVPEFRISENINFYFSNNPNIFFDETGLNWAHGNITTNQLLTLTGSSYEPSTGNYDDFLKRYVFSDFLEYFTIVKDTYEDGRNKLPPGSNQTEAKTDSFGNTVYVETLPPPLESTRFKIVCEAGIKFLPYDGFYPAERCVQLGTLFSQSATTTFAGTEANFRTLMQPFFAPGIVYNSIKSGLAVDYPIYTAGTTPLTAAYSASTNTVAYNMDEFVTNTLLWQAQLDGTPFDTRIPFETLYEAVPLPTTILDFEPACRAHIDSTASLSTINSNFRAAMDNFLAESVNTFLEGGNVTQLKSNVFVKNLGDGVPMVTVPGSPSATKTYSMDVVLNNSTNINSLSDFKTAVELLTYDSGDPASLGSNPQSCSLNVNSSSIIMYSRATTGYSIDPHLYGSSFGMPMTAFTAQTIHGSNGLLSPQCTYGTWYKLASFEPYTPPYYDGFAAVRISVELPGGEASITQIAKDLQYTYYRMPTFHSSTTDNKAWANAMHMSASINLGGDNSEKIIFEGYTPNNQHYHQQIIFSPKWECPILDFTDKTPEKPFYSTIDGGVAKGMWHQYGEIPSSVTSSPFEPTGKKGIQLSVQQSAESRTQEHGDLATLLGFVGPEVTPQTLGTLGEYSTVQTQAKKNTLSEALVAIPFKFDKNNNTTQTYQILQSALDGKSAPNAQTFTNSNGVTTEVPPRLKGARDLFLDENGQVIDYANLLPPTFKEFYTKWPAEKDVLDDIDPEVYALLQKMHKYVVPPELDFLHNPSISPFVMYMWEFEVDLSTQDLQNIWQNIAPPLVQDDGNASGGFLKVAGTPIEHVMPTTAAQAMLGDHHNFFYDIFDEEITRWAVFKVKKRARNNYNNIIGRPKDGDNFLIRRDLYSKGVGPKDYPYSYNWPHDFYSLIELVKIDTSTTFSKRVAEMRTEED